MILRVKGRFVPEVSLCLFSCLAICLGCEIVQELVDCLDDLWIGFTELVCTLGLGHVQGTEGSSFESDLHRDRAGLVNGDILDE